MCDFPCTYTQCEMGSHNTDFCMTWSCKKKGSSNYELKPVLLPGNKTTTVIPITTKKAQPIEESTLEPSYYQASEPSYEPVNSYQQDQSVESCDVYTVKKAFELLEAKFSKANLSVAVEEYGLCTVSNETNAQTSPSPEPVTVKPETPEPATIKPIDQSPVAVQPQKPEPFTAKPESPETLNTKSSVQPVTLPPESEAVKENNETYFPMPSPAPPLVQKLPKLSSFFENLLESTGIKSQELRRELLAHCAMLQKRLKRSISNTNDNFEKKTNGLRQWVFNFCFNQDFIYYCASTAIMIQLIEHLIIAPLKYLIKKMFRSVVDCYSKRGHSYQSAPNFE